MGFTTESETVSFGVFDYIPNLIMETRVCEDCKQDCIIKIGEYVCSLCLRSRAYRETVTIDQEFEDFLK